jgi:hypothetical protein
VLRQPRCGIRAPNVDRVARNVSGRVGFGNPSGSFLSRAVLQDRLLEKSLLVLRRTPTAIDEELDPVVRGMSCGLAQSLEESCVEVGYTRDRPIEDDRAVGDGTVSLATRDTELSAKTTVLLPGALVGDVAVGDTTIEDEDIAEEEDASSLLLSAVAITAIRRARQRSDEPSTAATRKWCGESRVGPSLERVNGETALSLHGLHSSRRCTSSSPCKRRSSQRGWLLCRAGREARRECHG